MYDVSATVDAAVSPGALLQAASLGDQAAWQCLIERYSSAIAAVTRAHRLDAADASDVHQSTWLRLIEHRDGIREPDKLGAWLITTARNECLRIHRHARRLIPSGDELDSMARGRPAPTSSIEDDVIGAETSAAVLAAIATLPANHRSLIRLLMRDPTPSYEEVATILRMPIGSIGPTRGRCLAKLRMRLAV
jgi:RNA polymerase sigma factor (sigma-70 family)